MSFQEIVTLYPDAGNVFKRNRDQLTKISDSEFRRIKDRLCLSVEFISRAKDLDTSLCSAIVEAASMDGFQAAKKVVESSPRDGQSSNKGFLQGLKSAWSGSSDEKSSRALRTLHDANDKARNIADSQFFLEIINANSIRKKKKLKPAIQDAMRLTEQYLNSAIPRTVNKMVGLIKKVQEDACTATVRAETTRYEDEEQRKLRLHLIRHINGSTTRAQHV